MAKEHAVHKEPPRKKSKFFRKFFIFLVLALASVVIYFFFKEQMISILKMNPYVWWTYNHLADNIGKNTLLGLFYMSLAGALFFIPFNSDIVFFYYLTLNINPFLIIFISIIGGVLGHIIDYLFGRLVGVFLLKKFMKENFEKYSKKIENWGAFLLVPGNILPIPMDILSVFYGAFKFNFKKFFWLTLIAKTIKFILFYFLGNYIIIRLFPILASIKVF